MDAVDEVVLSAMEAEVLAPLRLKHLMGQVIDASNAGLEALEKDIARRQASLNNDKAGPERLYRAIDKGIVDIQDKAFAQRIADVKLRIGESGERIRDLENRRMLHSTRISDEQVAAFSQQVRERLRSGNPAFRRAWLHLFVDRVVIGPDEIRILGPKQALAEVSFRETSRPAPWCPALTVNGAPERIRTSDPQIRSLMLYPAELRARDNGSGLDGRHRLTDVDLTARTALGKSCCAGSLRFLPSRGASGADCSAAVSHAAVQQERLPDILSRSLLGGAALRCVQLPAAMPGFRQFLGDAVELLAPIHLPPDLAWHDAELAPQHHEIVDEVGALADHRRAIALHGLDADLDRLLAELLGHFRHAFADQLGSPRSGRIARPGCQDGGVKSLDRISHRARIRAPCKGFVTLPPPAPGAHRATPANRRATSR
jgi:hypothetical protein